MPRNRRVPATELAGLPAAVARADQGLDRAVAHLGGAIQAGLPNTVVQTVEQELEAFRKAGVPGFFANTDELERFYYQKWEELVARLLHLANVSVARATEMTVQIKPSEDGLRRLIETAETAVKIVKDYRPTAPLETSKSDDLTDEELERALAERETKLRARGQRALPEPKETTDDAARRQEAAPQAEGTAESAEGVPDDAPEPDVISEGA